MSLSDYGFSAGPFSSLFILSVFLITVVAFIALVLYFSRAIAYYELAKRVGLKDKWYGFIPVFRDIACGNIAAGKQKSVVGKFMAVLSAFNICLFAAFFALFGAALIKIIFAADMAMADGLTKLPSTAFAPLNTALIPAVILVFSVVLKKILRIVSVFRIYLKVAPKKAVIFIILGILIPFLEPVFLFSVRMGNTVEKKDDDDNAVFDFGA